VANCDHLANGIDLLLDVLEPEYEFLIFAKQLGAFPFQFPFNAHVVLLPKVTEQARSSLVAFATEYHKILP